MTEFQQFLIMLIQNYGDDPVQFMDAINHIFEDVAENEKGDYFLEIGNQYFNLSYNDFALITWSEASKYFLSQDDNIGFAMCYDNMGAAFHLMGSYKEALTFSEIALKIFIQLNDPLKLSSCYRNIGCTYCKLKDYQSGIEYLSNALGLDCNFGNIEDEFKSFINLLMAYNSCKDYSNMIDLGGKFLKKYKNISDKEGIATSYHMLGEAYLYSEEYAKAVECLKTVINSYESSISFSEKADCLLSLSNAYGYLGQYEDSINYSKNALLIYISDKDKNAYNISSCYENIGSNLLNQGDFWGAGEYFKMAIAIMEENNDEQGLAENYSNLGSVNYYLNFNKEALKYYNMALDISRKLENMYVEGKCNLNISSVYLSMNNYKLAAKYSNYALLINEKIKNKTIDIFGNYILSDICYKNNDYEEALVLINKSVQISIGVEDYNSQARGLAFMSEIYFNLGNLKKAIEVQKEALEICKQINSFNLQMYIEFRLSLLNSELDENDEAAYDLCKDVIEISERMYKRLVFPDFKIQYEINISDYFKYIILYSIKLNKKTEAFDYLEKSKSRSFLDLLSLTKLNVGIETSGMINNLLEDEESCLSEMRKLQAQYNMSKDGFIDPKKIEIINNRLDVIYEQIDIVNPEYVSIRKGKTVSLDELKSILRKNGMNCILVEYFIISEAIYIFVVPSEGSEVYVETVLLPIKQLYDLIDNFERSVVKFSSYGDIGDGCLELGKYLINPISKYISKGDLIYFVPYGPLHHIPLHALILNGEPIIKNCPVLYSPSASTIKYCVNKGAPRINNCIVYGVDFEDEAVKIGRVLNSYVYLGKEVTKESIQEFSKNKDLIHFSCHGIYDEVDALSSGIKLFDGILTAREIYNMTFNSEIITLSACESGINDNIEGEDLIGLTRAFLYAGTRTVMVSLWKVNSVSTQKLMLEFYKYIKNGDQKAIAMQKAQISIMEESDYSHPFYWAPFILIGA